MSYLMQKLNVGEHVADRLEILDILGENALGVTYLMSDIESQEKYLVVQLGFECTEDRVNEIRQAIAAQRSISHKSLASLKDFLVDGNCGYVLMDFIDGVKLTTHLQQHRENGQLLTSKTAYSFLAHLSLGLDALHKAGYSYGCLSPDVIFVTREGRIRISNFILAYLADKYLDDDARNAYYSNAFCAPEVRETRGAATPASDVYSLALLFAELLSDQSLFDFDGTPEPFVAKLPNISTTVKEPLFQASKPDAEDRFANAQIFRDALRAAVDAPEDNNISSIVVGVNSLRDMASATESTITSAEDLTAPKKKRDIFDAAVPVNKTRIVKKDVWTYQKDGMDYGPYSHEDLIKKFYDDVIEENTCIYNTQTKQQQILISIPEFTQEVKDYLPIREKNHAIKKAEERKKSRQKKAAGWGTAILIIIILAVILGAPVVYFALQPDPKPLNFADAMPAFEKKFELPKLEAVSLNVDDAKAKAFFDPKATEAEREAALRAWEEEHRKKYAGKMRPKGGSKTAALGEEIETLRFTDDNGVELEPLADWEIEEQCMSPRILRKVQECYSKHAGGRQINTTVSFTIQTSGLVKNLSTSVTGDLDTCIRGAFSSMHFRQFGGTSKKVSIPVGY